MLTSATGLNSGAPLLALWAFSWWWGSLFVECFARRDDDVGWAVFLGLWGASTFAFVWASNRLNWAVFQVPQYALLIVMLLGAPTMAVTTSDPWEEMAWLGWPLVVAFYFAGLRILEARPHKSFFVLHGTPLWLFVFLGMWCLEGAALRLGRSGRFMEQNSFGSDARLGCCAVGARVCTPLAAHRLARRLPGFGRRAFDDSRRVVAVPGGHRLPERQLAHGLLTVGESHRYQRRIFATRYIDVASGMCSTFR